MPNVERRLTLPNVITCARIIAAPIIVYAAFTGSPYVLISFICIAVSDFFDGKIARRFHMVSEWGKTLDPLADKVLVVPILGLFLYRDEIGLIVFLLIFTREVVISVFRWIARQKGYATPSLSIGKWKANFEFVAIGFLLATPNQLWVSYANNIVAASGYQVHHIGSVLLWCGAILAWLSLIQLWYAYRHIFLGTEKGHH